MRSMLLGTYDTAADGLWTLASWSLSPAEDKQNMVEVPGRDGALDLGDSLTDGEPCFYTRTLTVVLESSEGDRLARKGRIDAMINQVNGRRMKIVLPDDGDHYIEGRVRVAETYNDLAHCAVQVTAVCDPWKYADTETSYNLQASTDWQYVAIINAGRRAVVPVIDVTIDSVDVSFGDSIWSLSTGTYQLPDVYLTPGSHTLGFKGTGRLNVAYREAVL